MKKRPFFHFRGSTRGGIVLNKVNTQLNKVTLFWLWVQNEISNKGYSQKITNLSHCVLTKGKSENLVCIESNKAGARNEQPTKQTNFSAQYYKQLPSVPRALDSRAQALWKHIVH